MHLRPEIKEEILLRFLWKWIIEQNVSSQPVAFIKSPSLIYLLINLEWDLCNSGADSCLLGGELAEFLTVAAVGN